jgi:DNA polymerase-3 subunit gamma/tau
MVLIRLCYLSDQPPPGELVRRLTEASAPAAAAPALPSGPGGGARAVAGGAAPALAAPAVAAVPQPASFREVVALAAAHRELKLHAHLLHSVHLVRFAPPVIELRPEPDAPRGLAARLAALLTEVTGTRWTIALSAEPGQPTLAAQGQEADTARRGAAAEHPLVRAILQAFPGARIEAVRDAGADAYGLPAETPDGPGFAPPESVPADEMPEDLEN